MPLLHSPSVNVPVAGSNVGQVCSAAVNRSLYESPSTVSRAANIGAASSAGVPPERIVFCQNSTTRAAKRGSSISSSTSASYASFWSPAVRSPSICASVGALPTSLKLAVRSASV